jgi:hypothetical protein
MPVPGVGPIRALLGLDLVLIISALPLLPSANGAQVGWKMAQPSIFKTNMAAIRFD